MTALIDTSVLIDGVGVEIDEPWVVSIITVGELEAGVLLAGDSATRAQRSGCHYDLWSRPKLALGSAIVARARKHSTFLA